ncbi:hypothetical protein J1N35_038664 [Gossypium stocksii]|uniref:Peptidase S59 domain-containing protein n=1 Tax=Gossypium stocksii TaxID=47602 RepID=A0A9D3UMW8_9ROSI|nr:hypothetical protein J1N35_038664 [Gossypium stocksii]
MASVAGTLCEIHSIASEISRRGTDVNTENSDLHVTLYKKRKISAISDFLPHVMRRIEESLPSLHSPDYYMEPCLEDMVRMERLEPGYCSRVPDFVVGRSGYGCVKFFGKTDVRGLDLDQIVKFHRHEVIVYEDESNKPLVGQGLNKTAEVTLKLQIENLGLEKQEVDSIVKKLRQSMRSQGAHFIAFDPANGEWKFLVDHFSRFGLSEDDEEDIIMDDATGAIQDPGVMNGGGNPEIDEDMQLDTNGPLLSHSLPAHLGLDPVKMREMRMLMFPVEEEEDIEDFRGTGSNQKQAFAKEYIRSSLHSSSQRMPNRTSPPVVRKTPVALLEYNSGTFDSSSSGTVLMTQENKGLPLKTTKREGFKLDIKQETPVTGSHSHNIVDAALFMGRSFRVGWGPSGILVHSGAPVGRNDGQRVLSSVINVEKVAIDKVVRDENSKVKKELVDFAFDAPLNLHKALNYKEKEVDVGSFQLKLLKVVSNRLELSGICRSYIDIIERQLEVPGLSSSARLVLMHQVMVWELIKVLFSERENTGQLKSMAADNEEDMMQDIKEGPPEVDLEALPLIRRAEFSCWLQESVCHRVQEEVSSVNDSGYLEHLFFLLTGRQLDAAVELAASKGDVRLACLLSQAGGSTVNRSDVSRQLDIWRINGLDFNFIEKDRIRLYELLAGNIHGALHGIKIDWKRFLGLLMWYHLPSDTALPVVFRTYQHLLDDGKAPFPVPIYIDEGPVEENANLSRVERFDLSYYLMLLHASEESQLCSLKAMFSTFSSTHDPLDYHMIWHQRAILEAVGAFHSNDLQALDMGLVSQLLCQEQCHWAIYVALHMPYHDDYPYLQATLIREILFQYCESWSSQESQRQFIEDLGIPLQWLHEAMAVYYNYHGDLPRALEHFLECENWQKAHSIFMTSVAHALFLSAKDSEVWRIATSMENHKSEIENWDLGAGIYISFYVLRSSFQEDNNTMAELGSLNSKIAACRDFLDCLNESSAVWGGRLHVDARVAYSKMADEICNLLLSDTSGSRTHDEQLSCYDTVFSAPIPEDIHSSHLQDAVAVFTFQLSEVLS